MTQDVAEVRVAASDTREDEMGFGKTAARRRQAARQHLRRVRECPRCGLRVRGNAYANHKRACQARATPADAPGGAEEERGDE